MNIAHESGAISPVLLTGVTGYVGGRLLSLLEARGERVVCLARDPARLQGRLGKGTVVAEGDVLDAEAIRPAFAGIRTAYYLIHALGADSRFVDQEIQGAKNFVRAAAEAGVQRIIYLGGLGDDSEELSPHLASRHAVGKIFRESGILTIELRASIIIGSGSLSFEMVRALTEHLPAMVMPKWVSVKAQPISILDVLEYLLQAARIPLEASRVVEIGGSEQLSYRELMVEYARQRGLKRLLIPVPVLTPRLSSYWLGLVTPLYARIGRKLIDSTRHPTLVTTKDAVELFPSIHPLGAADAIRSAMSNEDHRYALTSWSDSLSSSVGSSGYGGIRFGNRLVDHRSVRVAANAEQCFARIEKLGGDQGWPAYDFLWRIRGGIDVLFGGVGMRRGCPQRPLRVGDALDFWRVDFIERPKKLSLRAEMKLPGRAWLQFEVQALTEDESLISQTALFDPLGVSGLLYWYSIYPLHSLIFRATLKNLAQFCMSAACRT